MNCPLCGLTMMTAGDVCNFHFAEKGNDWARRNRDLCNFVHRGIPLPEAPEPACPPLIWMRDDS